MIGKGLLRFGSAMVMALAISACTADVENEGELPDVDVEGGEVPEYDVDAADVDVTTDTQQVITPDIDINAPEDTL
jgi:hypothetical protein